MGMTQRTRQGLLDGLHGRVGGVFGTFSAAPAIHIGLHGATDLTAQAAAAQAVITTQHTMAIGTSVIVGLGGPNPENHVVQNVTGAGPYTVTLVDNLANLHPLGAEVLFDPADDGSDIIEPSTGGYARQAAPNTSWNDAVAAEPVITDNSAIVAYTKATADYIGGRRITHIVRWDALAAGNILGWGRVPVPQPILLDNTPSFPVGSIDSSLARV